MRDKQEILKNLRGLDCDAFDGMCRELTLEVLIDIRDSLADISNEIHMHD